MVRRLGRLYPDGESIVRQGEASDCLYVIQKGRVEVVRREDGDELRLAVLEAGEVFGEMGILERTTRTATVRALGPTRVLTIDRRTFLARIQEDPTLAWTILETLSRRIRRLNAALVEARGCPGAKTSPVVEDVVDGGGG